MITRNTYVSNDTYAAVKQWMTGTINGFKDDHGIVGRPPMHFDQVIMSVSVAPEDQDYYGFSKDVELWTSQWKQEVAPLDLEVGNQIRVGFNQSHVAVVVEKH